MLDLWHTVPILAVSQVLVGFWIAGSRHWSIHGIMSDGPLHDGDRSTSQPELWEWSGTFCILCNKPTQQYDQLSTCSNTFQWLSNGLDQDQMTSKLSNNLRTKLNIIGCLHILPTTHFPHHSTIVVHLMGIQSTSFKFDFLRFPSNHFIAPSRTFPSQSKHLVSFNKFSQSWWTFLINFDQCWTNSNCV
jgi:hypothetical protein